MKKIFLYIILMSSCISLIFLVFYKEIKDIISFVIKPEYEIYQEKELDLGTINLSDINIDYYRIGIISN